MGYQQNVLKEEEEPITSPTASINNHKSPKPIHHNEYQQKPVVEAQPEPEPHEISESPLLHRPSSPKQINIDIQRDHDQNEMDQNELHELLDLNDDDIPSDHENEFEKEHHDKKKKRKKRKKDKKKKKKKKKKNVLKEEEEPITSPTASINNHKSPKPI